MYKISGEKKKKVPRGQRDVFNFLFLFNQQSKTQREKQQILSNHKNVSLIN